MLTNPNTTALLQTYLIRTIAVLTGVCTVAVFLYGIFLLLAVSHTASRTAAQKQVVALNAHLGSLEMQYLTLTKDITPGRAAALGFINTTPDGHITVFTGASSRSLSLSLSLK